MILVLTHKIDLSADQGITRLETLGQSVLRVNVEDYPLEISLSYYPTVSRFPHLTVYGKSHNLSSVNAVWYRVPFEFSIRRWAKDYQLTRFIEHSCNHIWYPLELHLNSCYWLNRPLAVLKASYKLHQLEIAGRLGLRIPRTCITSDPNAVRRFYELVGHNMVVKTICGGAIHKEEAVFAVFTNVVSDHDMEGIESVRQCPCQFQEYVPKKLELRVIVVGNETFAIEIDSQKSETAKHDWRHYDFDNVTHRAYKLPSDVREQCIALARALELGFGAIDMIVTPQGEHVFLEINPTGQYQWLEALTGLDITESIVNALICGARATGS